MYIGIEVSYRYMSKNYMSKFYLYLRKQLNNKYLQIFKMK